jgi:antitoxin ParD1/3/4
MMRYYGDRQMTRFAKSASVLFMTTMNVSLPDELKIFVDERVSHDGYGSTSEYVRDLIRRDRERGHLRDLVLEGANSGPGVVADVAYFDALRQRISTEA